MTAEILAFAPGQFTKIPRQLEPHLAKWRQIHRDVYRAMIAECHGRKRTHLVHAYRVAVVIQRLQGGEARSKTTVQKAMADLRAWGFLRTGDTWKKNSWRGREWFFAGLDFQAPRGFDYLAARPDFKSRQKGAQTPQGAKNQILVALQNAAPALPTPPLEEAPALPTPGGRGEPSTLPTPGGQPIATPDLTTKPPLSPKGQPRKCRSSRRARKARGGGMDQLRKAWASEHARRGSPLTPTTLRAALSKARKRNPDLTEAEIIRALVTMAARWKVPDRTNHPIIRAAAYDLKLEVEALRRPGFYAEFEREAPRKIEPISAEQLAAAAEFTAAPPPVFQVPRSAPEQLTEAEESARERFNAALRNAPRGERWALIEAEELRRAS